MSTFVSILVTTTVNLVKDFKDSLLQMNPPDLLSLLIDILDIDAEIIVDGSM